MNNAIDIQVRCFPVRIRDTRSEAESTDHIALTKMQLQAAQMVGQSSTELICRIFNRKGYQVLDIGKPIKRTVPVDLYLSGFEIIAEGCARTDQGAIS